MNPLARCPHVSIGKSNFSPIVLQNPQELLRQAAALSEQWQEIPKDWTSYPSIWLAERGVISIRLAVQWYPPKRPPYCVKAIIEHSGPFLYQRFLEAFGGLQCVLPEWRESLKGSDWEAPAVTHVRRLKAVTQKDIGALEELASFDGQNGVTTGRGQSRDEALQAVKAKGFKCRIVNVEFDSVQVFNSKPEKMIPENSRLTTDGSHVLDDELTEEDRPSGEWARICRIGDDTFRNRMSSKRPGPTWRIVEAGSQRYRVHVEDLPASLRGSKKQRDEFLKAHWD